MRHSHLWGARNSPSSWVIDCKPRWPVRQGRTERQVLAKPSGHPLVGGLSSHGVSGLRTDSLAHWLPGGIPTQGMRRWQMQAWVSCSVGGTTACDPRGLGGDQCVSSVTPTLSTTTTMEAAISSVAGCRNPRVIACDGDMDSQPIHTLIVRPQNAE